MARSHKITANTRAIEPIVMKIGSMGCTAAQAYRLVMAAGHDIAGRRAREAGRTAWSRADYSAACRFTNGVFRNLGMIPAGAR